LTEERLREDGSGETEKVTVGTEDVLATGGVDDTVRVWTYTGGDIKLKHKLCDHSLGVVSIALNHNAECEVTNAHGLYVCI